MVLPALAVSFHARDRFRERFDAGRGLDTLQAEAAILGLIAAGAPWGKTVPGGTRHVLAFAGVESVVFGIAVRRDGRGEMVQTALTLDQATANATARGPTSFRGGRLFKPGRRERR